MKRFFVLSLWMMAIYPCVGQVRMESDKKSLDTTELIAKKFIWFNDHASPSHYVVEEPDIHQIYLDNPRWIKAYFPEILLRYDLNFPYKVIISCYLYLEGEKSYLKELAEGELSKEQTRALKQICSNFKILIE